MNRTVRWGRYAVGAAIAASACVANASFTTYASQSAFGSSVTMLGTDTFNDLAVGELGASLNRTVGGVSYNVSSASGLFGITSSGTALSNDDRRDVITFTNFSAPVTAIGAAFFGTNESGTVLANQSLWVTVTDSNFVQSTTLLTLNSASSFFGVTSSVAILSMTLSVDASNLLSVWPTVDNVAIAAVPEPSSWALLAVGVALVAGTAVRRRQT